MTAKAWPRCRRGWAHLVIGAEGAHDDLPDDVLTSRPLRVTGRCRVGLASAAARLSSIGTGYTTHMSNPENPTPGSPDPLVPTKPIPDIPDTPQPMPVPGDPPQGPTDVPDQSSADGARLVTIGR